MGESNPEPTSSHVRGMSSTQCTSATSFALVHNSEIERSGQRRWSTSALSLLRKLCQIPEPPPRPFAVELPVAAEDIPTSAPNHPATCLGSISLNQTAPTIAFLTKEDGGLLAQKEACRLRRDRMAEVLAQRETALETLQERLEAATQHLIELCLLPPDEGAQQQISAQEMEVARLRSKIEKLSVLVDQLTQVIAAKNADLFEMERWERKASTAGIATSSRPPMLDTETA
eukprot:NODE_1040_length_1031_cov_139.113035_g864_i0.p2 GENE.NODE_1040_length_1031_cov_139.113035_g864_i0~~NODE_1040_length_1031_cov_139.113035_g864_i0.p2  ORF type:complete len:230 (-),score=24.29 NODE_1040_length_1031_cov_139.113035_g864_i0:310-999(-)